MRSSITLGNRQVEQSLLDPLYRKFSQNYESSLCRVPSPNGQNLGNTHPSDIELKQSVATENLCIKWNVLAYLNRGSENTELVTPNSLNGRNTQMLVYLWNKVSKPGVQECKTIPSV